MVGIHIDTTDRKRTEEELRAAKEAAEAASKSKSEFLANMSHEIRTPMNGVFGTTELLLNSDLTDKQRHLASTVHRSGRTLLAIINDILDFSKIEAGKLELESVGFDLSQVLSESLELFVEPARRKQIQLTHHIDENVPLYLKGDPVRFRQILMNLLSNAIKFTETGHSLCDHRPVGRHADPGPFAARRSRQRHRHFGGREITHLRRLFTSRWINHSDGTVGPAWASPLPSSWSHSWAEPLRWTASPEADRPSPLRPGSTANPLGRITQGAHILYASCLRPIPHLNRPWAPFTRLHPLVWLTSPLPKSNGRILLAEDSPVNREVAVGMLELLGYEVEVAENGRQALLAADRENLDMILMDCQMPEMDGLTATRQIRERAISLGRRRVPIIALTAHAMQGYRDQCLAAGMDDYLTKPYSQMQLRDMVLKWLQKKTPENPTSVSGSASSDSAAMPDSSTSTTAPMMETLAAPAGVDLTALVGIRKLQRPNRPDVLASILRKYLDHSRHSVDALGDAIRANDPATLQAIAHRLKSSSAQLGAIALAAHCQELETMGSRKNLIEADRVFAQLESDYLVACAVFRNEIAKGKQHHDPSLTRTNPACTRGG